MRISKLPILIVLVLLLIVGAGLVFARLSIVRPSWTFDNAVIPVEQLKGQGDVNLLACDGISLEEVQTISRHYKSKYGLDVRVLSGFTLPTSAWNPARKQFVSEDVLQAIASKYPKETDGRTQVYVAVTDQDIYVRQFNWDYTFAYRDSNLKIALVSKYRMNYDDQSSDGKSAAPEVQHSRLQKMITRVIGVLYFRLPLSNNPRNVTYSDVGGTEELDIMVDDFLRD